MKNFSSPLFILLLFASLSLHGQTQLSITEARQVDADGSLVNGGQMVELTGIAIGPNFRGGGHTWVLFDAVENLGITVFAFNNDVGYSVTDGDELRVTGELDEFNGLAEIIPDMIEVLSSGNAIPDPQTVTTMNEQTEAKLIRLENVMLEDPDQWGSSDFNVDITDGTNTFQMRIDGDTDIAGMAAPQGTFNVVGVGGQFDSSAPYFSGYQIFPRSASDIDPYDTGGSSGIEYEEISMEQAREVDLNGVASRFDDLVAVQGITHGVNIRPSGLQFTIINDNNVGINIFSSSNPFGYTFEEGDELLIKGRVDQFNGLTQINPDSLFVLSSGNSLVDATAITEMNESHEGSLVVMQMNGWVDETDWSAGGSGFNIDFITSDGITQTIRIDADTELYDGTIPDGRSFVSGIVGQFDSSEPFDEGYQLYPFSFDDFDPYLSVSDRVLDNFKIYPNPVTDVIRVDADYIIKRSELFGLDGRRIQTWNGNIREMFLDGIESGTYMLIIHCEEGIASKILQIH